MIQNLELTVKRRTVYLTRASVITTDGIPTTSLNEPLISEDNTQTVGVVILVYKRRWIDGMN